MSPLDQPKKTNKIEKCFSRRCLKRATWILRRKRDRTLYRCSFLYSRKIYKKKSEIFDSFLSSGFTIFREFQSFEKEFLKILWPYFQNFVKKTFQDMFPDKSRQIFETSFRHNSTSSDRILCRFVSKFPDIIF